MLSASAVKTVLTDLAEAYRRESGNTVKLTFATAGEVEKRVLAGEAVDVIVGTDRRPRSWPAEGLLQADTRAIIARVGVGIGAREGARQARHLQPGRAQAHPAGGQVRHLSRPRARRRQRHPLRQGHRSARHRPTGEGQIRARRQPDFVCVAVAKGEVELCVHQISEIMPVKGVTLVGPLPKEVQRVTTFAIALSAKSTTPDARAFLAFVTRPAFKAKFAEAGLDYRVD